MSLEALHRRLMEIARQRVRSGELSERGLARLCGVSQPHMHNALKDIRGLSNAAADRLLDALDLSVPELLWKYPGESENSVRAIPLLRNRVGPGTEAIFTNFGGYIPFPAFLVKALLQPVAARVAPELVLPRSVLGDDLILLDQNPSLRMNPGGSSCWVVSGVGGLRIRYVRLGGTRIYLANEENSHDPKRWESVSLSERTLLDVVRARVVWVGRYIGMPAANAA